MDFVVLFKMMIDEENGVDVKQRKKGLKSYSNCFIGVLPFYPAIAHI